MKEATQARMGPFAGVPVVNEMCAVPQKAVYVNAEWPSLCCWCSWGSAPVWHPGELTHLEEHKAGMAVPDSSCLVETPMDCASWTLGSSSVLKSCFVYLFNRAIDRLACPMILLTPYLRRWTEWAMSFSRVPVYLCYRIWKMKPKLHRRPSDPFAYVVLKL